PRIRTAPDVGCRNPSSSAKSVDLPAPFGPTTPHAPPSGIDSVTSFSASIVTGPRHGRGPETNRLPAPTNPIIPPPLTAATPTVGKLDPARPIPPWTRPAGRATVPAADDLAASRSPMPQGDTVPAPSTRVLGQLMLSAGMIDAERLAAALEDQRHTRRRLGELLVARVADPEHVARALAAQLRRDYAAPPLIPP